MEVCSGGDLYYWKDHLEVPFTETIYVKQARRSRQPARALLQGKVRTGGNPLRCCGL